MWATIYSHEISDTSLLAIKYQILSQRCILKYWENFRIMFLLNFTHHINIWWTQLHQSTVKRDMENLYCGQLFHYLYFHYKYLDPETEMMSTSPSFKCYKEYLCSIKDCLIKVTYFLNLVFIHIHILIYTYVHTVCVICYHIRLRNYWGRYIGVSWDQLTTHG